MSPGPTAVPTVRLSVNGLPQDVRYDAHALDDILLPRLRRWIAAEQTAHRSYAFLVAPPGTGKSVLAVLLERALAPDLQCVGMDGFHLPQTVLEQRTLKRDGAAIALTAFKGAPETFDLEALDAALEEGRSRDIGWPVYDRRLHDVVPDAQTLTARHVLVEGNWLLLNEPGWRDLARHADLTIRITAPTDLLAGRLIDRKVQGGLSPAAARDFLERSDGPNIRRALDRTIPASLTLSMDHDGLLHEGTTA